MRPLAFIDVETTGLDPRRHEIIEVGVIRVTADTLEELDSAYLRVRPEHIEDADPRTLSLNGYCERAWDGAPQLIEALFWVSPLLEGAALAAHNVSFDRAFLEAAWRHTGVVPPPMDHHVLDTVSLAWPLVTSGQLESLSLEAVCAHLGIARPIKHHALADAKASLNVARRLLPDNRIGAMVRSLEGDERAIVETLLERLSMGRERYGPWRVSDGRDYRTDTFEEVLDALHYCAAELVRLRHAVGAPAPHRFHGDVAP